MLLYLEVELTTRCADKTSNGETGRFDDDEGQAGVGMMRDTQESTKIFPKRLLYRRVCKVVLAILNDYVNMRPVVEELRGS